jgi:lysozyme
VSDIALALLKFFEGFRAKPYLDVAGHGTVGYGHLILPNERDHYVGRELTKRDAEILLLNDWAKHASEVATMTSGLGLLEHEREALTSFAFNLGPKRLQESTLFVHVKRGERQQAAAEFLLWRRAGGTVQPGLAVRRHVESVWYLGAAPGTLLWMLDGAAA